MSMEPIFRIAFWLIFGGMIALQACFTTRLRLTGQRLTADRKAIEREGWLTTVILAIRVFTLIAFLVLYAIRSPWLETLAVPFSYGLRWIGIALGVVGLALNAWARATLGSVWSSCLQMRVQHHLVTTGPYKFVRHPIYLAMMCFATSIALVTGNWITIAFLVVSLIDLARRIPKEEQMMIEVFGDEYLAYMRTTGGLFPKRGV
jgi:protein-S-isoprenylcysteine O-methyltransferase Ste14